MLGCTPVDRMTDTRLWKHYPPATSFADGNKCYVECTYCSKYDGGNVGISPLGVCDVFDSRNTCSIKYRRQMNMYFVSTMMFYFQSFEVWRRVSLEEENKCQVSECWLLHINCTDHNTLLLFFCINVQKCDYLQPITQSEHVVLFLPAVNFSRRM